MTWTYDTALTATKDQVRLLIGDTVITRPQLQDEEIAFLVTRFGTDSSRVAVAACDVLIARYAGSVTKSIDGMSASFSDLLSHYQDLRANLLSSGTSIVGPLVAESTVYNVDGTEVKPFFTRQTPNSIWSQGTTDDLPV